MKTTSPPPSQRRMANTIGYYVAFITLGLVTAALGPTVPRLADRLAVPLRVASLVFTGHSLGYLIGSFLGGRLFDRLNGHPIMAIALVVIATMMALVPALPALWLLVIVIVVIGTAQGALDVGGNTLLVWVHGRQVGPFMNGLHFFFGLGALLSPIIIDRAVALGGLDLAYRALALLTLPAMAWTALAPSPHRASTAEEDGTTDRPVLKGPATLLLGLLALFFLLYVGAEIGFSDWIFEYGLAMRLVDETGAAYLTSTFWGAFTAGRLLSIPLAARFRPRQILTVDLVGSMASLVVMLAWPHSSTLLFVSVVGLGLSMASIFPTAVSLAERRLTITGRVTSWFFVGASAGGMLVPWLIGQLFESVGPRVTPLVILIDLAVAVGIFVALLTQSRRLDGASAPSE